MRINSTIRNCLFVALAILLLTGPIISPAISPSATSEIMTNRGMENNAKVQQVLSEKKIVPCKVFTPEGVYETEQEISLNELKNLKSMLNETAKAIQALQDENATIDEINDANKTIYETVVELKRLGLMPGEPSINDIIKLLEGRNRIKLNISSEFLSEFEKANTGCFVWGNGQIVTFRLYLALLETLRDNLYNKFPLISAIIGHVYEKLWEVNYKSPKMFTMLMAFGNYPNTGSMTVGTIGLLGGWSISGSIQGLVVGFTGIWLPDFVIGYSAFAGIYFCNP